VDTREAVALIHSAIPLGGRAWADVGAGDGTFTRALAKLLGPRARIYAIDRDARALEVLRRRAERGQLNIVPIEGDFTQPLELPEPLDGMLIGNALHFVRDADVVLNRLAQLVRPGGRIVIVEYDRRAGSRWVPYPIPSTRLSAITAAAGLSEPTITATRPSAYGGTIYVATADRSG
jgi:ubiquinone/menaquinone biosynthesis C-methylase UbiE